MIDRIAPLWAARGWLARRMEAPGVYSGVQRLVGSGAVWKRLVDGLFDGTGIPARGRPGGVAGGAPPPHALRVLDVGCGPADLVPFLPAGVDYLGIDLHAPYLARAARRHPARRFRHAAVEAVAAEAPGAWDLVLVIGVLHHLDDAAARALLAAALRARAPDGRIVALEPLRAPGQSLLERQFYVADRGRHVRTGEAYAALFDAAGGPIDAAAWPGMLRVPYTYVRLAQGATEAARAPARSAS